MNRCLTLGLALIAVLLMPWSPSAMAANTKRAALIIGNAAYKTSPLANPANDANDMAALLKKLGFHVTKLTDASRREMKEAINAFGKRLRKGGTGLFYFAGHGVQVEGINYLIPIGAIIESERDVQYESVNANRVLSKMQDAGNPLNMVFLDACRNNPFARMFRSAQQGLAPMDAPKGSLVAFATAPGNTAADGTGRNGVFTKHLITQMPRPGLEIGLMMRRVRAGVQADTGDKQTPFELSSLTGSFYFNTAGSPVPSASPSSVTLPPQPPGTTSSGIGDYEAVAQKRKAVMAKWRTWQNRMESEYEKAETLCQDPVFKSEEKADIWRRFLSAYGDDNPYSDRDEALRARAAGEHKKWNSRKGQKLAMAKRPRESVENRGLVAYYPFNGNANDESGNGNDGVEKNGVRYADGISGQAAIFDGVDDYIEIASSKSLMSLTREISICLWIKRTGSNLAESFPVSKRYPSNYKIDYDLKISTTRGVNFHISGKNSPRPGLSSLETSKSIGRGIYRKINDGKWHLVVVTHKFGNTTKSFLYLDGQVLRTNWGFFDPMYPAVNTLSNLLIGKQNAVHEGHYNGQIDDLRIYNRALSQAEILLLLKNGFKS